MTHANAFSLDRAISDALLPYTPSVPSPVNLPDAAHPSLFAVEPEDPQQTIRQMEQTIREQGRTIREQERDIQSLKNRLYAIQNNVLDMENLVGRTLQEIRDNG